MAWVRIDDSFPDHPKVVGLGDKAFRAYIVALAYANRYLTDGFIPAAMLPAPRIVKELVGAGLWERPDDDRDGVLIHDYHDFQPSRDDKVRHRADENRAKSRAGKSRASNAIRNADGTFLGTDSVVLLDSAGSSAGSPAGSSAGSLLEPAASTSTQPRTRTRTQEQEQHLALRASRERDEVFDAVAEVCGIAVADLTRSARGSLNRAVADLKAVGATAGEVKRRAGNWPFDVALTPPGLAKHYAALTVPPRQQTSTAFQIAQQLQAEGR